jgi:hypothetical protein
LSRGDRGLTFQTLPNLHIIHATRRNPAGGDFVAVCEGRVILVPRRVFAIAVSIGAHLGAGCSAVAVPMAPMTIAKAGKKLFNRR